MPTTQRTRTIAAPAGDVWALVSDPHHLPRWWPRVARVEGVEGDVFTKVLTSPRGRMVRADFQVVGVDERELVLRWAQQVEGTPFARLLAGAETELRLRPVGRATEVTIELRQALRGIFPRLGASRIRRAARATLDEALDGLERIVG
ncbi:MAG TPA: SRPBCC family protein [Solirubrobacteraceae bacterium]|nr:SRPBCC family protein [Solirubrobacteraceae bacterium]